jgi:hypothetical protein
MTDSVLGRNLSFVELEPPGLALVGNLEGPQRSLHVDVSKV